MRRVSAFADTLLARHWSPEVVCDTPEPEGNSLLSAEATPTPLAHHNEDMAPPAQMDIVDGLTALHLDVDPRSSPPLLGTQGAFERWQHMVSSRRVSSPLAQDSLRRPDTPRPSAEGWREAIQKEGPLSAIQKGRL